MDPDPLRRLDLPYRPLDAETFNGIMTTWLSSSDDEELTRCELQVFASFTPIRPVLDSLMFRAHHDVPRWLLSPATAHRLLKDVLDSMEVVAGEFDEFRPGDEQPLWLLNATMQPKITAMLRAAGTDARNGEHAAVLRLLEHPEVRLALREQPFSTTSLVLVLLGDGTTYCAQKGLWSQPLWANRLAVLRVALMQRESDLRTLFERHARLLTALQPQLPMDRVRAMVAQPERGSERRAARPGFGFMTLGDLAKWSGSTVASMRPKVSRTLTACASAYANPAAPIGRVTTDELSTTQWITDFQEGQ